MRFLAVVSILILGPLAASAQTTTSFNVLHTFSTPSGRSLINSDGASPLANLVLCGQTLFGTTSAGGADGYGTVFQVNTDGSGFRTLYNFTNGIDGATPKAPLLLADGMLYGTASAGGFDSRGTVFALDIEGMNFSTLYAFTNGADSAGPVAGLVLSGNALYGTTAGTFSGTSAGTLFMLTTNGPPFSVLHQFSAPSSIRYTNDDGFLLSGPLFLSGNTLYGVATEGGANGCGTLFTNASDGSDFGPAYTFAAVSGFPSVNGGGANPQGGVVISGTTLFGTAYDGGANGWGTVYQYDLSGAGLSPLYCFTGGEDYYNPQGPLTLSSNMLYGTTPATIFSLTTDGSVFSNLFSFPPTVSDGEGHYINATGSAPNGGLALAGQSFYGTTQSGGSNGFGTVFAFNLFPPALPLTIQQGPGSVVLTWTNSVFALQSAPTAGGIFTNVPGATSPYTNVLTDAPMFFRLLAQ